jgi:hypothetical protein
MLLTLADTDVLFLYSRSKAELFPIAQPLLLCTLTLYLIFPLSHPVRHTRIQSNAYMVPNLSETRIQAGAKT